MAKMLDSLFKGRMPLVDVSGYLLLAPGIKLIGSVNNALGEEYVASRHPAGARPGRPLTALAGLEFSF